MDGNKIKQIRIAKGISQTELAKMIKSDRSYLNKVENNKQKNPGTKYLARIAAALDCSISDFF
ncbi:helix-turn-helix domain-containing protein [Sediminibacillus massiliensis]|uniref:helix-turn-helix domain-containing protein n=1 Tax=Sediminibacillus massiliensis TaxID=1926277 RepID=UPI0009888F36|nr:helix-turn-helix transcriptional regulator [Sediminibacillus massiliensis]